ncbi:MAG: hypothetical protein KC877_00615 [Candidatus Kaiserbacteria bacterium]|nr:hypothetical protein [Candidatus Kaiserbacteria bacterium]MCB9815933.1 hypothetical protein [Candidatus Nomurabacteria bacterium]
MKAALRQWIQLFVVLIVCVMGYLSVPQSAEALNNIIEYSDTLSDSGPNEQSNHTFKFVLNADAGPGTVFEFTPPAGFAILSTTTFAERNVELWVNGAVRTSAAVASPGVDQVDITTGSPGLIQYTLAPDYSITSGSRLEFRVGSQASTAIQPYAVYSTSTGSTTVPGDAEPIVNAGTTGLQKVALEVIDGTTIANIDFLIFLVEKVSVPGVDTTEEIPPYRFNGSPTSSVGGTTLSVEISLETDEFAICKFDTVAGTSFAAMPHTFSNTGLIFHSQVVAVTPDSVQQFYVRCIDDEDNFNIDDYLIIFTVNEIPTGSANTEGSTSGDGSGSGDEGTGTGSGGGGESGDSNGEQPLEGGSSGSGGSGGGGGGGSGGNSGGTSGGGFEDDAPYQSGDGRVIISGYAYPNSTVGILVDGNFFDTTRANSSGEYSITLDEIARGVYTFGVYASGPDDTRSSTFSTSFTVTGARTSELTNVNVAPSILVEPDPVDPGETLTVSGYALPNATVSVQNGKLRSTIIKDFTLTSNASGFWSTTIDTSSFSEGTYQIRAKSEQTGGAKTNWSEYTYYGVGGEADVPINADLNRDGKVNLVDFSILLFWWASNGGDSDPPADINRDGTVSLTDFSIMLFNWTG